VPIDFDGNWPEMNLRPTAALLRDISVAPRSFGIAPPRVIAFPLLLFDSSNSDNMFYSDVVIFNWCYLSSPPQVLRRSVVHLGTGGLVLYYTSDVYSSSTPQGGRI
jgi:hypothetical protein